MIEYYPNWKQYAFGKYLIYSNTLRIRIENDRLDEIQVITEYTNRWKSSIVKSIEEAFHLALEEALANSTNEYLQLMAIIEERREQNNAKTCLRPAQGIQREETQAGAGRPCTP